MPGENGKGTYWKVVGTVGSTVVIALLAWLGTQLMVVPQHTYQLQRHEQTLDIHEKDIKAMKEAKVQEQAERQEMLALLRDLAARKRAR